MTILKHVRWKLYASMHNSARDTNDLVVYFDGISSILEFDYRPLSFYY